MEKFLDIVLDILEEQRIKHTWHKIENSRKLKHYKCERCDAEKWFEMENQLTMYMDRFGKTHYRAPDCVYPNTKLNTQITELFSPEYIYPVKVTEDKRYKALSGGKIRTIRYEFITKDDVLYLILLNIWDRDRTARIDFHTESNNPEHRSIYQLINTRDAIKVFNTIKSILEKHKQEFDKLIINSAPERIEFYKKLLDYLHINYKPFQSVGGQGVFTSRDTLIATL